MKKMLIFKGHGKAPEIKVPAITGPWADGTGLFKYDFDFNEDEKLLTVTFKCEILILNTLTGKELLNRQEHEKRHFNDFHSIAIKLQQSLQRAIDLKKPTDMDNRMKWFDWDVNEASNVYHRSLGMMPYVKIQPIPPRPNP